MAQMHAKLHEELVPSSKVLSLSLSLLSLIPLLLPFSLSLGFSNDRSLNLD
jgi:hypothetical protein